LSCARPWSVLAHSHNCDLIIFFFILPNKSKSKKAQRAAPAKSASTCTRLSETDNVAAAVLNTSLGEDEGAASNSNGGSGYIRRVQSNVWPGPSGYTDCESDENKSNPHCGIPPGSCSGFVGREALLLGPRHQLRTSASFPTETATQLTQFRGPSNWNKIPINIASSLTINSFKKLLCSEKLNEH
jgi:hypothetical protein